MTKKAMDKLITRKEAASILGISVKTLDAVLTHASRGAAGLKLASIAGDRRTGE